MSDQNEFNPYKTIKIDNYIYSYKDALVMVILKDANIGPNLGC